MSVPLLAEIDAQPLQEIAEAGLIHTGRKWTVVEVWQPGGQSDTNETLGSAISALLTPVSADDPIRSEQPSSAGIWWLDLPTGTVVKAGEEWQVEGTTGGTTWLRTVLVQRVEFPGMVEITRKALVLDTVANP